MSGSIQERTIFGIAGIGSLILGLYIGYRYLGFFEYIWIPYLSIFWQPGHLDSLVTTLTVLIIGVIVSILFFMIASNLLNIAYNLLIIAIKDTSPNRDWTIYIDQGKNAISLLFIPLFLFGLGAMVYSLYAQWNPHIGEMIYRDNVMMEVREIEAIDKLYPYYDCELVAGTGWKFIILNYYISHINNTNHATEMRAGNLVDENGISYSNYYKDCLPKDEYYYIQKINRSMFGKLLYRIPLNAVPGKISFHTNSTSTPRERSLQERPLL
ncbi:MAG: hypothetical protein AB7E62_04930, partial [Methanothrix sp.]